MGVEIKMLTETEKLGLRQPVEKIITYKLMLAKGFLRLAKKTKDQRTKSLLTEIGNRELEDKAFWDKEVRTLGLVVDNSSGRSFLDLQVVLMMGVLGPRGFAEWAIIAEDESVETLLIQAENIRDSGASDFWTRAASDERLHIDMIKTEVLGMESWEMGGGGGVRDVIFGANDGLVSILALVAGVFGAAYNSQAVLIAGVAGAVAGTISMGAGAYVSSKSEQEVTQKETQRKGSGKSKGPEGKLDDLVRFYQEQGFEEGAAVAIAKRVAREMEAQSAYNVGEDVGLTSEDSWPPAKAGLLTGISFLIFSLIPVVPFVLLDVVPAAITASFASILAMFFVGASKAVFTRKSWLFSGLEVMGVGIVATIATYLIGLVSPF
jgi:VIT1/CCC1 family predicted Fe2+/Mn2+ transporter/rubrerythrin